MVIIDSALDPSAISGHISYGLLVLSMLMSSIIWLRIIALISGVAGIIYSGFVLHDPVGTGWECLFTLANTVQLSILVWRSRRAKFTDEEFRFCQNALVLVPPAVARQFIDLGEWRSIPAETVLTTQNEPVDQLTYIADGSVEVSHNECPVAECGPGDFIGELGILSGRSATATTKTTSEVRALVFEKKALLRHLRHKPDIKLALQAGFKENLREKLTQANERTLAEMR